MNARNSHGGAGFMEETEIARMYTLACASRIYAGASSIMTEIIVRGLGLESNRWPQITQFCGKEA